MQKIKISSKNKMEAKEFPDNDKKIPFVIFCLNQFNK